MRAQQLGRGARAAPQAELGFWKPVSNRRSQHSSQGWRSPEPRAAAGSAEERRSCDEDAAPVCRKKGEDSGGPLSQAPTFASQITANLSSLNSKHFMAQILWVGNMGVADLVAWARSPAGLRGQVSSPGRICCRALRAAAGPPGCAGDTSPGTSSFRGSWPHRPPPLA